MPFKWDDMIKILEISSTEANKSYDLEYKFTNTGHVSVKIIGVKTSCGCTVARMEKTQFAPGEAGLVSVKYHSSDPSGGKSSRIAIETDQGNALLELKVQIPNRARVAPDVISWMIGQKANTQVAVLTTDLDARIDSINMSDSIFNIKSEETVPGRQYKLFVTPKSVSASGRTLINLGIVFSDGGKQSCGVLAKIR